MLITRFKVQMNLGLVLIAAVSGLLGQSPPARAESVSSLVAYIDSKTDQEVWNMLTLGGVGKCRIADATACATCYCNYYLKAETYRSSNNYDGLPSSNNDCPSSSTSASCTAARKARYFASRLTPTMDSTGCLPMAIKSIGTTLWNGNNGGEETMTKEQYSKVILLSMIQNSNDPCGVSTINLSQPGVSVSNEDLILNAASSMYFSGSAGSFNSSDCYQLINGAYTPQGYFSSRFCRSVYYGIVSRNQSPQLKPATATSRLNASSLAFRTQSLTLQRAAINQSVVTSPALWGEEPTGKTASASLRPTTLNLEPLAVDAGLTTTATTSQILSTRSLLSAY